MTSPNLKKIDADLFKEALDAPDDSVFKKLCAERPDLTQPNVLIRFMEAAILWGDERHAQKIIEIAYLPTNAPLSTGSGSLLSLAALTGRDNTIKLLIKHGDDPNGNTPQNPAIAPPLFAAIVNGHSSAVDLLIAAGASIDIFSQEGYCVIHKAIHGGAAMLKKMCKIAPHLINHVAQQDETTPLLHAVGHSSEECATVLLEAGADIRIRKSTGVTALHLAARNLLSGTFLEKMHEECKKHGIDIDTPDKDGWTPLFYAAASPVNNNNLENTLKTLVKLGADINARDSEGKTPIFYAYKNHRPDSMLALIEQGANPTLRDYNGTGLMDLEAHECKDLAEILHKTWIENERIKQINRAKKEALEGIEEKITAFPRMKIIKKAP